MTDFMASLFKLLFQYSFGYCLHLIRSKNLFPTGVESRASW